MRPSEDDLAWMRDGFPDLTYDPERRVIEGILSFSAVYNNVSGKLRIGCEDADMESASFLSDAFSIKIDLSETYVNGLPVVYETGGRRLEIAAREGVDARDIHFYENGQCCLGIQYAPDRRLTLEALIDELLVPFLYRLSYTDRYGLASARRDLWGEYSHGQEGHSEYERDMLALAS